MKALIKKHFDQQRRRAGSRTLKRLLEREEQITISRRRVSRLMRELNLYCLTKKKFKATTYSKHNLPVTENILNRQFSVNQPNCIYVGDITYVWTTEGWLYVSVWLDLFSRAVVGWSMKSHMKADLATDALDMAIQKRAPTSGLIVHSDRGVQYASSAFQTLLNKNEFICSMSRKGKCWDNSVFESFFHSLKTELVHQIRFETRDQVKRAIFDYIEVFYNRQRAHSTLDYVVPLIYEAEYLKVA